MNSINLKEARKHLGDLVAEVERGASVAITRRGRKVARLVPMEKESPQSLPDLALFRASIKVKGGSLTDALLSMRHEERF